MLDCGYSIRNADLPIPVQTAVTHAAEVMGQPKRCPDRGGLSGEGRRDRGEASARCR